MSAIPVYIDSGRQCSLGYEQHALGMSVKRITPPQGALSVMVKVEGAAVRYRDDGVDPTPAVGMPLEDGEVLIYDVGMQELRFVGQTNGAIINVVAYGG